MIQRHHAARRAEAEQFRRDPSAYRITFDKFDADDSGRIGVDDLEAMLEYMGVYAPKSLDELLLDLNTKGIRTLDFPEFRRVALELVPHDCRHVTRSTACFDSINKNRLKAWQGFSPPRPSRAARTTIVDQMGGIPIKTVDSNLRRRASTPTCDALQAAAANASTSAARELAVYMATSCDGDVAISADHLAEVNAYQSGLETVSRAGCRCGRPITAP